MKLDTHGIRFRFWLVFFALAVMITLFIGMLQVGLIRPYYRNSKIRSVSTIADSVSEYLIDENGSEGIMNALRATVDNNVCVVMYNAGGRKVYEADSLGSGCIFHAETFKADQETGTPARMIETLDQAGNVFSKNVVNDVTGQEMIVYGKKFESDLSTYYLYVNSPLEPVDSTVTFFSRQYGIYMLLAIIMASFVAFYISSTITRPIVRMRQEAQKLAKADYTAAFEGGSFTETRELAEALNSANRKLKSIDELRRDLIANVSHDMRTPLTDIRAYAEMIRDISGDKKEKREKHLDVIIRETDYMNHLISDMSELSKMQSGNYILHKENMDLCDKIREIVMLDTPLIEKAGLNIEMNIPDSITMYADEVKIGQIIANYLSNAIKHTPTGGKIMINAYILPDEETVRCEVADNGDGIPDDELPYIWDRYQKSSRTYRRNMTNTGLGLAIVKAICDTHGAKYGVQTQVGKGSTFWFELRETHEA